MSIADAEVTEGDAGDVTLSFPVTLAAASGKTVTVNRWNTTGLLISSASSNESGYLSVKVARGLGMVALDTQARI